MTGQVPYYVVKKGRGFWQPNRVLRAKGFRSTPCGLDGPEARAVAAALTEEMLGKIADRLAPDTRLYRTLAKSLKNAKERASRRRLPFDLTMEGVCGMVRAADFRCAVTGLPFHVRDDFPGIVRQPFHPSIDRIDNSKGYVAGNARVVLTAVNYAMNQWGETVFFALAEGIVSHRKRSEGEQKLELGSRVPTARPGRVC